MGFLVMESFTDYLGVKSRPGKGTTVLMRKNLKP
jgi:anti-sigma regulatory factor (Ser/Thr protein kinase)